MTDVGHVQSPEFQTTSKLQIITDMHTRLESERLTFIFVSIQQILEFCVENFQVFFNEHLLTLPGQFILRAFMKVDLDSPLFLEQTSLCLQEFIQVNGLDSFLKNCSMNNGKFNSQTCSNKLREKGRGPLILGECQPYLSGHNFLCNIFLPPAPFK